MQQLTKGKNFTFVYEFIMALLALLAVSISFLDFKSKAVGTILFALTGSH